MQLRRNEIMTGLLVLSTVAVLCFILILLGAPGLFRPLIVYKLYFDNAAGIKLGAPVLLAGRKVGQVKSLNSPVSREDAAHALEAAANLGTVSGGAEALPRLEVRIDIEVDRTALVYKNSNVRLMTLGLLGETAIDISGGTDHSARAEAGQVFIGNRVPDFSEAIAKMLGIIGPVATQATATFKELQNTVAHISKLTDENAPLTLALGEFKTFTEHLNELTAPEGSLSKSLAHIEDLSNQLTKNDNITVTLANFRDASAKLDAALESLNPDLKATIGNAKDFTATVRSQPWRLIWPSTKKYPQDEATPIPVRRAIPVKPRRATP
ncbi:MAG TPA: MlaD family protein [Chthoniobacterales bacterium]|jgi:ABC-type transporter Mla subunit MlaD|nr:MlaD family protein [Chthoniobacterales bacterium]